MIREPPLAIVPDATADEAAAVLAALTLYCAQTGESAPPPEVERWTRAGRLEAVGLPVTPATLRRGWRG